MNIDSLITHPKDAAEGYRIQPIVIHQFHLLKRIARYGSGHFSGLELLADAICGMPASSETASDSADSFSNASANGRKTNFDGHHSPNVKPKRKRANLHQLEVLKETFQQTPFPSAECRKKLAKQLGMAPRSVQIWFQNQRQMARNLVSLKFNTTDN